MTHFIGRYIKKLCHKTLRTIFWNTLIRIETLSSTYIGKLMIKHRSSSDRDSTRIWNISLTNTIVSYIINITKNNFILEQNMRKKLIHKECYKTKKTNGRIEKSKHWQILTDDRRSCYNFGTSWLWYEALFSGINQR